MPTSTTITIPETLGPVLAFPGGQDFYRAALEARLSARPVVSGYSVGAAALLDSGETILGANREYPSDGNSDHAEQNITTALGDRLIRCLIAVDKNGMAIAPCGACRDKLLSSATPDAKILVPVSINPLRFEWAAPQALLPNTFHDTPTDDAALREVRAVFGYAKERLKVVAPSVPYTSLFRLAVARTSGGKTFLGYHIDDSAFQHDYAIENALSAAFTDGEIGNISLVLYVHNIPEQPIFPEGRGRHKLFNLAKARNQDILVVSAFNGLESSDVAKFYFSTARTLYPYAFDPKELR